MSQEYANRGHRAYDAGKPRFVPGNQAWPNMPFWPNIRETRACKPSGEKRPDWNPEVENAPETQRPSLWVFGRRGIRGESTWAKAALHFGLDIAAEIFGNDARSGQIAQVGDGELRQVGKNGSQRS
jgi:hypothetical protein